MVGVWYVIGFSAFALAAPREEIFALASDEFANPVTPLALRVWGPFEVLVKVAPKNVDYLVHLAGLYEQIGKTDKALKTYQKVLDLDPENPKAQESYLRLKMQQIGG